MPTLHPKLLDVLKRLEDAKLRSTSSHHYRRMRCFARRRRLLCRDPAPRRCAG